MVVPEDPLTVGNDLFPESEGVLMASQVGVGAVSYTHLTLPTSDLV